MCEIKKIHKEDTLQCLFTAKTLISFALEAEWSLSSVEAGKELECAIYVCLSRLYVEDHLRCKGFGRKLLREGIAEAKKRWPDLPIRLAVEPEKGVISVEDLIAFYESEGFYIESAEDVIVMRHD